MKITLVRPSVVRITFDNGAFYGEYNVDNRVMLGKNRGNTERIDLAQVEREARQLSIAGTAIPTR